MFPVSRWMRSSRALRNALWIAACLCAASTVRADAPKVDPLWGDLDKATAKPAPASETESFACGTPKPSLKYCRGHVREVQAELNRRERRYRRTGEWYNAGWSLVGCAVECNERYPSLPTVRIGAPWDDAECRVTLGGTCFGGPEEPEQQEPRAIQKARAKEDAAYKALEACKTDCEVLRVEWLKKVRIRIDAEIAAR